MANDDYFDPFGWDDDTSFNPEDIDAEDGELGDDITDIDDMWDLADYDFGDLEVYEFHGTGDTGGTE